MAILVAYNFSQQITTGTPSANGQKKGHRQKQQNLRAKTVKNIVKDKVRYSDWNQREDIKAELKVGLILVLAKHGYPPVKRDELYKGVFE